MLNINEIKLVNIWTKNYPVVFHWGWHNGYGLSMKETIDKSEFG